MNPRKMVRWHGWRIRSFYIGDGWAATYWYGPSNHAQVNGAASREAAVTRLREFVKRAS